jgi:hypothetical protein
MAGANAILERLEAVTGRNAPLTARIALAKAIWDGNLSTSPPTLDELRAALQQTGDGGGSASAGGDADAGRALTAAAVAIAQLDAAAPAEVCDFVLRSLLPHAAGFEDAAVQAQAAAACIRLLAQRGLWAASAALLDAAAARAAAADSASTARDDADTVGVHSSSAPGGLASATAAAVRALSPSACGVVVAELVDAAVTARTSGNEADECRQLLVWAAGAPLLPAALAALCSSDGALRRAALQRLLPAALEAARALGPGETAQALHATWDACAGALGDAWGGGGGGGGGVARRMALAALLQHADCWDVTPPAGTGLSSAGRADVGGDAAASGDDSGGADAGGASASVRLRVQDPEGFWAALRGCLADPEPLNRKRALRLLQALLPPGAGASQPAWGVWLGVLEALEEFTPHLQTATWHLVTAAGALGGPGHCGVAHAPAAVPSLTPAVLFAPPAVAPAASCCLCSSQPPSTPSARPPSTPAPPPQVSQLHPVDPAFAHEDAGADVGSATRLNKLQVGGRRARRRGGGGAAAAAIADGGEGAETAADGAGTQARGPPLPFEWVGVLWCLALRHSHPHVQRAALRTLLKRDWSPLYAARVPASFLADVLLPALNAPIHHRGAFDAVGGAARLAAAWAGAAPPREARAFISSALEALAAPSGRDMIRSGIIAHMTCLEAAAAAAAAAAAGGTTAGLFGGCGAEEYAAGGGTGGEWAAAQLGKLAVFLDAKGWPYGTRAHAESCVLAARLAAHLAPRGGAGAGCAFGGALQLLLAMPAWGLAPAGGELHSELRAWLLGPSGGGAGAVDGRRREEGQQAAAVVQTSMGGDGSGGAGATGAGAAAAAAAALEAEACALWEGFFAPAAGVGGDDAAAALRRPSTERDYAAWGVTAGAWSR